MITGEGELSPRSYEKLPTLFGFSDSELLLNFLGKQGFVHPVLSSTQPTAETIAQLTAAEPKNYEAQIKIKAFNERTKSAAKIEGAMAMHNSHANLTKYRSTGDKFGNILLMELGRVGQFSNEGLDQEIEYLRKMQALPSIKAIVVSHTDSIDIVKVSR